MRINAILAGITMGLLLLTLPASASDYGSLVIRFAKSDKSCIQRVPLEVKIYALEQMFDV